MGKKFVNPVEKARRQAKKKEINKQKKQRFEARSSNLKGKDPNLIIQELERLDKIQYNIEEPPKLNEKVIESKRKKLMETWYRILGLYKKEDQSKYDQIKRLEMEYEAKKVQLIKKYEAVNSTKQVNLEEIPLPFCPEDESTLKNTSNVRSTLMSSRKLNLRDPQTVFLTINGEFKNLKPPGCPSSVPPSIEELENEARLAKKSKNAEKDLDEFLKEVDQVEKIASKEQSKFNEKSSLQSLLPSTNIPPPMITSLPHKHPSSSSLPNPINPVPFPILLNPMGLLNAHLGGKKPNLPRPPPPNVHHLSNKFNPQLAGNKQQLNKEPEKVTTSSTIEAKPQLRNYPSADVTKFLPTSLRIKRQDNKRTVKSSESMQSFRQPIMSNTNKTPTNSNQPTKDKAYEEFMKELNGLI